MSSKGGEHLFEQLATRDIASSEGLLAIEMDNRAELSNSRSALQGGLMATLIDVVVRRLGQSLATVGYGTATADMNIHFLAPIIPEPARAETRVVHHGRSSIVLHADVRDVGTDRLAVAATTTFAFLGPR